MDREWLALGGGGVIGVALIEIIRWWLGRGDRRLTREQALSALESKLRDEIRAENLRLQNQVNQLLGRVDELSRSGESLRRKNSELEAAAARDKVKIDELSMQNADRALENSSMKNSLALAEDRIALLEAALRERNIEIPERGRRRGDTGPLPGLAPS